MNTAKLNWTIETSGMFAGKVARAETLISDVSVMMRSDNAGKPLGFTLCMFGRMVNTTEMNIGRATVAAESVYRELLRDTLGTLRA